MDITEATRDHIFSDARRQDAITRKKWRYTIEILRQDDEMNITKTPNNHKNATSQWVYLKQNLSQASAHDLKHCDPDIHEGRIYMYSSQRGYKY